MLMSLSMSAADDAVSGGVKLTEVAAVPFGKSNATEVLLIYANVQIPVPFAPLQFLERLVSPLPLGLLQLKAVDAPDFEVIAIILVGVVEQVVVVHGAVRGVGVAAVLAAAYLLLGSMG